MVLIVDPSNISFPHFPELNDYNTNCWVVNIDKHKEIGYFYDYFRTICLRAGVLETCGYVYALNMEKKPEVFLCEIYFLLMAFSTIPRRRSTMSTEMQAMIASM